ncbi:5,6-dimethylbenzimidazole synthase, partial [Rhizobium leguminosarum]
MRPFPEDALSAASGFSLIEREAVYHAILTRRDVRSPFL